MKKNEELFYTINSLNSHELRYFKLFANRHIIGNRNTYMKLFDAIKKLPESDDDLLKKKFKKEAFVKNLPSAKLYLLRLINKSLYHYHDKEDSLSVVIRHIKLSEVYYQKASYSLAESHLKKARKIAEEQELFVFSLLISEMILKISISSTEGHLIDTVINKEMKYEKNIFNLYLNLREYQNAFFQFKTLEKTVFIPKTVSEKKQYDKILNQPIFSNISNALSKQTKSIFYELKNSYEDKRFDVITGKEINDDVLDFFIKHPKFFRKNTSSFIQAVFEYLLEKLYENNLTTFLNGLKKYKILRTTSEIQNSQIFYKSALLELNYFFLIKETKGIKELIFNAEKELNQFNNSISLPLILGLYHHHCALLFNEKNYKAALKWNIKVITDNRLKDSHNIKRLSMLANIILHIKLNNVDLAEKYILSEKRKRKTNSSFYKLDILILNTLLKIINSSNKQPLYIVKTKFLSKFEALKSDIFYDTFNNDLLFKYAFSEGKDSVFYNQ